jgi:hypothetical protein
LLFGRAELTGTFGDVEDDGGSGSVELILEMGATRWHELVNQVELVKELEGTLIDVELGVIEGHGLDVVRPAGELRVRIDNRDPA